MRRTATVAAVLALLVATGSGCVRSERNLGVEGATSCTPDALVTATGPVTVTVWHAINGEAKTALEDLAADYNASQDRVRVEVLSQGTSYTEVLDAYAQAIKDGNLPGLLHTDVKDMQYLIDTKTILPADLCFTESEIQPDLIPAVRNAMSVEGTLWPSHTTVSNQVMYYNEVQFEAAGLDPADPPGTLDELEEAARALKDSGVAEPLALLLSPGFVESWVTGTGEQIVNNADGRACLPTHSRFDNPATLRVFEWVDRMVDEGLARPYSTGGFDQFIAVASKTSSMVIETSTASTTIAAVLGGETVDSGGAAPDPGAVDADGINPASAPMPGLEEPAQVQVGGGAFFIPASGSDEVRAGAWDFSQYMASRAGQLTWHTEGSYLPTSPEVIASPELREFWSSGLAGRLLEVAAEQLVGLDPDKPGPLVGDRNGYADVIEAALNRVANEGQDPADAIAQADREIEEVLQDYAEINPPPATDIADRDERCTEPAAAG